jgi:Tol biopolymer transport system component
MERGAKAVVGVLVALTTMLTLAVPGQAAFPGKNGKIAFFGQADQDTFTVDPDGGNLARLGGQRAFRVFPSWSADGTRVAFSGTNQFGIAVMNADGTGETQLTSTGWFDLHPAWAPDGTMIAFDHTRQCDPQRCPTNVQVVNSDGTGLRTVCCGLNYRAAEPSWSPDGSEIAFERAPDPIGEPRELWRMRPDGSGAARVCCDGFNISAPDWAPDGSSIVFLSRSVMTVRPDGSDLKTVYTPPPDARVLDAAWSPDGMKMVLSLDPAGENTNARLYVVNADGSNAQPITDPQDPFDNHVFPSWQPIPGPRRADYKNAVAFCRAEQAFFGEAAFAERYGAGGQGANAFGKCVSRNP